MAIFDQDASDYDSWYKTKLGKFVDTVETNLAFDMLKPQKGQRILDAGCGTGNFSLKLARKGCIVTGIDVSQNMLNIAKMKAENDQIKIDFHKMDMHELTFPDEYFHSAISITAFEFLHSPKKALNELFRVVKKGGNILIGTINRDSKWGKAYSSQKQSVYRHASFKTIECMKNLRKDKLVDIRQCLFIPPDTHEKYLGLDLEKQLAFKERGGFICALWKK